MNKPTFVSKVMTFLKGGDEAKLNRFADKLVKKIAKDISIRQDAISSIKDEITDAEEALTEVVNHVSVDRIAKTGNAEDYVADYLRDVINARQDVTNLQSSITNLEEEIKVLEQAQVDIFGEDVAA